MEMEIPLTAHWEKVLILSLLKKASVFILLILKHDPFTTPDGMFIYLLLENLDIL